MEFSEALKIINHVIIETDGKEYDGIIVKRLEASNTLDEGRTTNQTHIAISGEQMDIFPYLMANAYFQCEYDVKDEDLKKYFITQIPLRIYKTNIIEMTGNEHSDEFVFLDDNHMVVKASIIRGRRKNQSDQVQLSLTTIDDKGFVAFRKILHIGDFLVLLKLKEKLEYDCIGIKGDNTAAMQYQLSDLNNKFYKLQTNTKVDVKNLIEIEKNINSGEEYTLQDLGNILKNMYENAEDKMQVASIHIFGIKYGKQILDGNFKPGEIIKVASLNESYATELSKALNIYRCLQGNKYGISIKDIQNTKYNEKIKENDADYNIRSRVKGGTNILLYGVPGAGKSYTIKKMYCKDEKYMERVVFHPDYTYSDFVGQILPRVENKELKYIFTPGPFTKLFFKAENDPENMYYLIIEEINRGNAPAIFGEIFQLLDRKSEDTLATGESEYGITNYDIAREVYDNPELQVKIPSNMSILATMNTADQNVFTLDTAFQRRWDMKQIRNIFPQEHATLMIEGSKINWGIFATVINELVTDINSDVVSSEDKRLGAYFIKQKEMASDKFPEKVLKYLWDDAFKMDKYSVFKEEYRSLEDIISAYEKSEGDKLAIVLRAEIYIKMLSKMKDQRNTTETLNTTEE